VVSCASGGAHDGMLAPDSADYHHATTQMNVQVEERKNAHINGLMKQHESAFAEIKNYYNDITANNLDLIKVRSGSRRFGWSFGGLNVG